MRRASVRAAELARAGLLGACLCGGVLSACTPEGPSASPEAPGADQPAPPRPTAAAADGPVLATVAGVPITAGSLQRHLDSLAPFTRSRYKSPARRRELLDTLIRFELLAQEAARLGLDERPEIRQSQKQMMIRQLIREVLPERLPRLEEITDEELRAAYEARRGDYERPEQVRAAHILLESEEEARRLLTTLQEKSAATPRDARRHFAEAARAHSVDQESRERDGDLQYFSRPGAPPPPRRIPQTPPPEALVSAAFALPTVGAIHPTPLQSDRGWHLLQKTGHRPALLRRFEEVQISLRNQLYRERKRSAMEGFVEELRARAELSIDEAALARFQAAESTTPAAPAAAAPLNRGALPSLLGGGRQ